MGSPTPGLLVITCDLATSWWTLPAACRAVTWAFSWICVLLLGGQTLLARSSLCICCMRLLTWPTSMAQFMLIACVPLQSPLVIRQLELVVLRGFCRRFL